MGTITDQDIGKELDTDGYLGKLVLTTVPTEYGQDYLCLTDGDGGPALFNMHVQSSPVSAGSVLMDNGSIPFKSLFVKSAPVGGVFDYELGTSPETEEPPPPETEEPPPTEETETPAETE